MDVNDNWSLLAVVQECAQRVKLRSIETTIKPDLGEINNPQTPFFDDQIFPMENSNSQTPFLDQIYPRMTDNNNSQTSFFSQILPKTKEIGFMIPSPTGEVNSPPPAANSSTVKTEPTDVCRPSPSLTQTNGMSVNLVVGPNLDQHVRLRNFQNQQESSVVAAVGLGHQNIDRRKNLDDRREVKLRHDELTNYDNWAWRKYGQKPIKGSPYPRSYYRCSSMKGCKARKQVDQFPQDPDFYIVTYTGHHHHPYPPPRNANGSRVKITDPNPQIVRVPHTPTMPAAPVRHGHGFGSGLSSGFGGNEVKIEHIVEDVSDDKTNSESFGSAEMDEGDNNDDGYGILIPNMLVDTDLVTGMNQLIGSRGKTIGSDGIDYYNAKNVGSNDIKAPQKGVDLNVKMEFQVKKNWSGFGIRIGEEYGSAPPSSMGQNIWGNGMNNPQAMFY